MPRGVDDHVVYWRDASDEPCEFEDQTRFWPNRWATEAEKRTRFPRQANHWLASKEQRKAKVKAFNADVIQLIARRVRTERILAGVRQIDLAEAVGISQSTLSRIEKATRQATLAEIIRIAIQLRRPVRHFFEPPPLVVEMTGWENRRKMLPLIDRQLEEAAAEGELPEDDPIYD